MLTFKKICIFGAGGFAKEVYYLAVQCLHRADAFIDLHAGGFCCNTKIESEDYFDPSKHLAVVAVGNPKVREKIVNQIIARHGENVFATLIAPTANIMSPAIKIGKGSIICANCILTCDIELGPFAQLNLATTIGHDVKTGEFFTTAPGVHVNGKVIVGDRAYFGSNASTVEDVSICSDVTIGAGACVAKNITEAGIYVGIPAKKLENKNV
jgi:sugar O-acyltransferase (sialic acid O-acetyltransferase NeuD family)